MAAPVQPVRFAERHAGLLLFLAVSFSLTFVSLLTGTFGQIGPDGDDVMRLVQVRDLLEGQPWFDLTQPRLGPEGGTLMHWSRLIDLPIAAIAFLLTPLLGQDKALSVAITLWPFASVLMVTSGLVYAARSLGGRGVLLFTCLIAFAVLFRHFRFLPGAIDHHNVQLGLMMVSVAALVPRGWPPAPMAVSGACLALAAAVGVEVHLFVATLAGFVALDWAIAGAPARRGAVVFGASFAAVMAATFLITVPPLDYGIARCDAHSSVTLLAGLGGGAAFALAAQTASGRTLRDRVLALGLVAVLCAGLVILAGPQCISNPLDALSPQARELWLSRVDEARPTLALLDGHLDEVLYRMGTQIVGLGAALWMVWQGRDRRVGLLFVLLLTVSLLFALYQTRFYVFGQLFAILPLAVLVARIQAGEAGRSWPRLAYLAVLFVSLPAVWGIAGKQLGRSDALPLAEFAAEAVTACDPDGTYAELNTLAPGRILAPASDAPGLLLETRHSVLHGHYHRNTAGIDAALTIYTAKPDEAYAGLRDAQVDYLLVCPADADMQFFARYAPGGLIASILRGEVPGWLKPVGTGGPALIYAVGKR